MTDVVRELLGGFDRFVLVYFLALNAGYVVLFAIAAVDCRQAFARRAFAGHEDIFRCPLTPSVSVVVPAYNEERTIIQIVRNLLDLRYPDHEVIVVDDGSTDATFELLAATFDLVEVPLAIGSRCRTVGAVRSTHVARGGARLMVVRKDNGGTRADSVNAGLNAARGDLVCMVDADSMLDEAALLRVVKPFVDDPLRVVGSGGVVRAGNGCRVAGGRVVDARMPSGWLERIQVVEYLRAFLLGRTGWSRLNGLLIISGAFGVFRRDLVLELGGLDTDSLGEDCELVTRIHRHLRGQRRDYRIVFVAEPVCWTEVPRTLRDLGGQRRRWSHGLAQVMWKHRSMLGNPRYGRIGLLTLPYYLAFELLGAIVELTGVVAVALGLALGLVDVGFALAFAAAALGLGVCLSMVAVVTEEASYHRYARWRDLGLAMAAALVENVGYRQIHAWWRLRGLLAALRGRHAGWGTIDRGGLQLEGS